jgi:hypothetical protein
MPEIKLGNYPLFDLSRGLVPTTPGYQMWYEQDKSLLHIDDKIFRFVEPPPTPSTFTLNITNISLPIKIVGYQEGISLDATSFVSDYNVDWGDGDGYQLYPAGTAVSSMTHTYTTTGTKSVKVDKVSKPLTGTGSQEWFTFSTGTMTDTGKAIVTDCDTLAGFFNGGLTTVGNYFLFSMFYGCSSLTTAPSIPSGITTVGTYFLAHMFRVCTSLVTAPAIPAGITGTVGNNFLHYMFQGCANLITLPTIPINITGVTATAPSNFLNYTFYGCDAATSQTGTAANQPFNKYTASTTTRNTYRNCTALTSPTTYANIPAMWK